MKIKELYALTQFTAPGEKNSTMFFKNTEYEMIFSVSAQAFKLSKATGSFWIPVHQVKYWVEES